MQLSHTAICKMSWHWSSFPNEEALVLVAGFAVEVVGFVEEVDVVLSWRRCQSTFPRWLSSAACLDDRMSLKRLTGCARLREIFWKMVGDDQSTMSFYGEREWASCHFLDLLPDWYRWPWAPRILACLGRGSLGHCRTKSGPGSSALWRICLWGRPHHRRSRPTHAEAEDFLRSL